MEQLATIILALYIGGIGGMLAGMCLNPKVNFSWQLYLILAAAWPVTLPLMIYEEWK